MGRVRKLLIVPFAAILISLAGCSNSSTQNSPTPGAVNLPLHVSKAQEAKRAVIDVNISGSDVSLVFDTGSVGLALLASSAPQELANATGTPFQDSFADGVQVSGVIVPATVTLGTISTGSPIDIGIIQSVTCDGANPDCSAAKGMDSFAKSIGADGIFGAGLWSSGTLFSPLLQLSGITTTAISVHWDGKTGNVQLFTTPEELSGTVAQMPQANPGNLPNGVAAWDNQNVPICWQIGNAEQSCMPTVFDTGAAAMSFPQGFPGTPDKDVRRIDSGKNITGTIGSQGQPFITLTSGPDLGKNLVTVMPNSQAVNTGIGLFSRYDVLFSIQTGEISLNAQ